MNRDKNLMVVLATIFGAIVAVVGVVALVVATSPAPTPEPPTKQEVISYAVNYVMRKTPPGSDVSCRLAAMTPDRKAWRVTGTATDPAGGIRSFVVEFHNNSTKPKTIALDGVPVFTSVSAEY